MKSSTQAHVLASQVESYLDSENIALTMGGEPTFIVPQPDTPEWTTAAMGEAKLGYARRMTAELIREVYPGALVMQVFGKWYPGEPLPRWNCMLLHRNSGGALWPETTRLLLDDVDGRNDTKSAEALMATVAGQLELGDYVIPAHDPEKEAPVGWVLPLDYLEGKWASAKWPFGREKPLTLFIVSLLRYWQHHPALAYLFTGQYVGPGSQAPRVDEGPSHGLYELEVACEGVQVMDDPTEGELLDQFYRNLLTDSSGNTHRAEICFDKFCNPSAPNGKWGIIELRAFETFPQIETMSLIGLFVRTILARLFKDPFTEPLKRFGPWLHDRYFLPAFLWQDVQAICQDLQAHGFDFRAEWLEPVLRFRCPTVGQLDVPGGSVDLRQAFESFPLMAEESQGVNTVRVVDNSSDRLQLTLSAPDLLDAAVLLVNGVELPFESVDGQMICGLRYKCASAYPALHPHVPIQSPLEFEWVDLRSGKTLAAARYHFWNPHAPVYEGRPKTAEEAGQRRAERWRPAGDLIGRTPPRFKPRRSAEFLHTLDLRRQLRSSCL